MKKIKIEITNDEALVLFEFLARSNKNNSIKFEDQAEQRILWDIECILESALVEPLDSNYESLLQKARNNIRDPN